MRRLFLSAASCLGAVALSMTSAWACFPLNGGSYLTGYGGVCDVSYLICSANQDGTGRLYIARINIVCYV
jgi:hypothetical protein